MRNSKEVDDCAGSKYYPIEFSAILKTLKEEDGKYAIVGLPCVIKALRLVQQNYPLIGEKIKYLFGLTCGHNKNKNYASFLLRLAETKEKDVDTIQFRCKENTNRSSNYGFRGILKNGEYTKQLNFSDSLVGKLWCNYYFSLGACLYCKDLFADYADISFMDAWLNPYINDPKGTSIIISRNTELQQLLEDEHLAGKVWMNTISEKEVIKSQKGALNIKKSNINKKKNFLFNRYVSNKFYSGNKRANTIGVSILELCILFSQKYKRIKEFLSKLIRKVRIR